MSDGFWGDAIKIFTGTAGLGGGAVFVRWFLTWLSGRHDQRAAEIRADDLAVGQKWKRYTQAIEERLDRQEREVEECHAAKRELERRVAVLEGFANGMGDRRQEIQLERAREAADRSNMNAETGDAGKN